LREIAMKTNIKGKLDQKSLKRLREEQYEERGKRAGLLLI
jgi:hypothetical protein